MAINLTGKLKLKVSAVYNSISRNRGSILYRLFYTKGFRLLYKLLCFLPLDSKKVIFASDSRTDLSGNFEFVYKQLLETQPQFKYRFMLKPGTGARKSVGEIISLAYNLATSKFILLDDFYPMVYPLKIRDGAELIQLWHAVGAFKTFGYSRTGLPGGPSPNSLNHRNYTKAIVSSKNVAKHYAEGFGISEDKVIATGIPRTDIFFDEIHKEKVRQALYEKYPFLKNKKVIMFAPTFRGPGQQTAYYPTDVLDLDKLYRALGDEYVFLLKMHPFVKEYWEIPDKYSDFYFDFSSYREINDLLFITDILVTDYSSVCFEFALLGKPMVFFAPDVEEYIAERDFYYNYFSFIPGPLARSDDELIQVIGEERFEEERLDSFVHYFYDDLDGKSSERVVNQLIVSNCKQN
ncbi:CDP-glycerol glycerophosphotransferase family protein [Bacillus sp. FJAT-18017]|uniref:CDP-glycerol glycerophosphotransferase family protein n=1 Tax=Bacillus sp. FJAT-18017 TaxID=1705566 RepID=UPI000A9EC671|nr:CDP-glycerol glycerophosphotransferase family protein [Bacillus sp. FJAT-18017]